MIRVLIFLLVLVGKNYSVPLKPHLKGIGKEGSTHLRGGIRPIPSKVHGSPRRASSKVNRILILRANFRLSNSSFDTYSIGSSDEAYDQLTPQAVKYYNEQSYGFHQIEFEVPSLSLIGSQRLSKSHQETQSQGAVALMVKQLLDLWDPHIDFSLYDSVVFLHAGEGNEVVGDGTLIHSHRSLLFPPHVTSDGVSIYSYTTIPEYYYAAESGGIDEILGTFCHEYGHELGLPDLYDTTYNHEAIGPWGLMAGGVYMGPAGDEGTVPAGFCAWSKIFLGWIEPVEVEDGTLYTLEPPALQGQVLKIYAESRDNSHEFFLLENRFNGSLGSVTNWDTYLPDLSSPNPGGNTGILILHVDESVGLLSDGFGVYRWDANRVQSDVDRKYIDVEEANFTQSLDTLFSLGEPGDTWSKDSSVGFADQAPFLSEPYNGNPNGLRVDFLSSVGAQISLTIGRSFQVVRVDSSQDGKIVLGFNREIMDNPSISDLSITPSISATNALKISDNSLEILYLGTLDRSTKYSLSFPSFRDISLNLIPSPLSNVFGTNLKKYALEENQVWTRNQSPYVISDGDLEVGATSQLVIESGTVVLLGTDSGTLGAPTFEIDFVVLGQLIVNGTRDNPVVFTTDSTESLQALSWGNLVLAGPQDKPSLLQFMDISGGTSCIDVSDVTEHILSNLTIHHCHEGVFLGNLSLYLENLRDGGSVARIYNSTMSSITRGILSDSTNPGQILLNLKFSDFEDKALAVASRSTLDHMRFLDFEDLHGDPDISNSGSGDDLIGSDLNLFYFHGIDTQGRIIPGSGSTVFQAPGGLEESVSQDWLISNIEFLNPNLETRKGFAVPSSFHLRAVAQSATNFNQTHKRMLALRLQTLNEDHSQFITLEEEEAGGGVFLSENLSLKTSGLSSGSEVLVSQPDLLLAVALDSGQLSTTIPVGRFHPPENIDVQGGAQQLSVSWDPVLSASSYRVYYSTESPVLTTSSSMLEVSTISAEIGGLRDGTFYELLITALEGSSESDFSDGTGAFTLAPIPSLSILTGGRGEVQLTWDVVQSASSYNLLISTDPSFSLSSTQNLENLLPPQRIQNLLDGSQYYFALNSFNPSGNSSYSSPATTITIPSPPLNISLVGELEQVQLEWEPVLGASSYSIFSSTAPHLPASQTLQIQSTAPAQIISNLPPGSLITFALASLNSSGESSPSNPIQTWTLPTSPKAPDLSGGMGIISVSWDAVQGAQYYRVYSSTGPGLPLSATDTTDISGPSLNLEGLLAGTEYTVALEALNPSGHSELSNQVTTATIPSRPSGLSAQGAARSISVTWNLVSGASTYNLYLATGPSLSLSQALKFSGVNTPFQFDDLGDATLYSISLSSMNASGESSQTNLVSVLTLPSVPSELYATPEVEALSLSWPPVPGASGYHLYYSTQPLVPLSSSAFLEPSSSPVRLEELGGAETLYLSLSSLNSTGESSRSIEISATTLLASPLGLSVESGFGSVSLSWNPVPGAEGYEIHYFESSASEIIQTLTSFSSTLLLTGLADGAEFNFNVRAVSGNLMSSPSLSIRTITPLAVPEGLMIKGSAEPELSWNPVSGASSYAVFVSTDPIQSSEVQSTYITSELSLKFQALQKGMLHYFRLQSTNPLISSTLSTALNHLLPPDVPAGFSGISTGESIELSWNHTIGAMSYEIFHSESVTISTTTAQKLTSLSFPLSLDGFSSGTTYYFLLRAINTGGNGEFTPILPVSIPYFLRGDFNLDDRLDSQDLEILRAAWEGTSSVPDIASVSSLDTVPVLNSEQSRDGVWDLLDLIVFSMNWNWALANPDPKLWPSRQP